MNISQFSEYNSYPPWPEYSSCPPAAYGSPYREYSFGLSAACASTSSAPRDANRSSNTSVGNSSTDADPESESASYGVHVSFAVKVISPSKRSEYKTFMLKDIDVSGVEKIPDLREILVFELGQTTVSPHAPFELGYYKGSKRIWIRNNAELQEVLKLLKTGNKLTLWCDGKRLPKTKQLNDSHSDSDESATEVDMQRKPKPKKRKKTKYQDRQERIDDLIDDLREKHGTKYTNIQYRIWAECIEARTHASMDSPPRGSMFRAQGRQPSTPAKSTNLRSLSPSSSADAQKIAAAGPVTPGKAAELRSTYIKQIKELHGLSEIGAITLEQFTSERDTLLKLMAGLEKKQT